MSSLRIFPLESHHPEHQAYARTAAELMEAAFADPARYPLARLTGEVQPSADGNSPFYRRFFVAMEGDEILGVGGVKAADWASQTHILYLSAVTPHRRGEGIGKALIRARIDWVESRFPSGRLLVSTRHVRRFRMLGFREVPGRLLEERRLMVRPFG